MSALYRGKPRIELIEVSHYVRNVPADLPPLKWSSLRYDFAMKEDNDGKEEAHSRRDRREAASG